jgi:hypothetical protein
MRPGFTRTDLPEGRSVEIEQLADAAQGVEDLAVDPAGGQVDESCRKLGQQPLEPLPTLQELSRPGRPRFRRDL